jgi:adenylate cyclase
LVLVARTGEGLYEAELYRLRGEADPRRAEEDFRRAIEIARRQEARSLELRAAMSLYRLALRRGEAAPERRLLDQAYRGFTEGLETPDLADAARLLEAPA